MHPIDEERRRAFERHRREGGASPLEAFLPDKEDPTHQGTLEELVLIDMEFRWKAWHAAGARGPAPSLDAYADTWPALRRSEVRQRLRDESAWLTEHYAPTNPRSGATLAHYELRERVGRGASAEVWRARDHRLERDVALKIPHASVALDSQQMRRARLEAQAAAGLRHPGIVTVHGVEEHEGRPFFVLELVHGRTLADRLREGPYDPDEAALLVVRIAEAIAYAHDVGVVHRDLKPANILLDRQQRPRITDFGLARLAAGRGEVTQHGDVLGTPAYMAPEQARGAQDEVGPAVDVHALGVLLYEVLSGVRPFQADTAEATLYSVVHEDPQPLRRVAPHVPIDLETIVAKAMAREPTRRYASGADLAADLRRFLARRPIEARRVGFGERIALWVRRNPTLAATVALAVLAVGSVSALGLSKVLSERARFRTERDRAERNLLRSLLGEAAAVREARGVNWRTRAMALLRSAAPLVSNGDERLRLRNLIASCVSRHGPSFHEVAVWRTGIGAVRTLAVDPAGARVALVGTDGGLSVLATSDGSVLDHRPDAQATAVAWLADDGGLVTGHADGRIVWRSDPAGKAIVATPQTGDAVTSLATDAAHALLAVGRESGAIQVLRPASGKAAMLESLARLAGHDGGTLTLAFTPGGERLVSGGRDRAVRIWSWSAGTELGAISTLDAVRHVAAHGARWALSSSFEEYGFRLIDLGSARVLPMLGDGGLHARPVTGLVPMPGLGLLTASADGSLALWSVRPVEGRARFRRLQRAGTGLGPITACARLGTDGDLLAAHQDGRISRWRLRPLEVTHRWTTGQEAAFLPGTERLATTRGVWDYAVRPTPSFAGNRDVPVRALAPLPAGGGCVLLDAKGALLRISPDGRSSVVAEETGGRALAVSDNGTIFLGTEEGTVLRWEPGRPSPTQIQGPGLGPILALGVDAWGACHVLAAGGRARIVRHDAPAHVLDHEPRPTGSMDVNTESVALWRRGGASVEVRAVADDAVTLTWEPPGGAGVLTCDLTPDGSTLVVVDGMNQAHAVDGRSGRLLWSRRLEGAPATSVCIHPKLGLVFLAVGPVQVLDVATGVPVASVPVGTRDLTVAEEGTRLVLTGARAGAWFVSTESLGGAREAAAERAGRGVTPAPRRLGLAGELFPGGHPDSIWGLDVSPDGRWIATSGYQGATVLRDAKTLAQVATGDGFGEISWTVAFARGGAVLCAGVDDEVRVLGVPDCELQGRLTDHEGLVTSLAVHPREPWVVTTSQDRGVRLWDLERFALKGKIDTAGAHPSEVEFDPEGRLLGATAADGSLLLWDVRRLRERTDVAPRRLPGHGTAAWTLAFAPGGAMVATGSEDGQVLLREVASGRVLLELWGEPRLRSLSFSSDGRYLAGGCWNAPSTTWDLAALRREFASLGVDWR